jgi:hypothetical protein
MRTTNELTEPLRFWGTSTTTFEPNSAGLKNDMPAMLTLPVSHPLASCLVIRSGLTLVTSPPDAPLGS